MGIACGAQHSGAEAGLRVSLLSQATAADASAR